jgi:DNA (cytosine-5)-methyltransferase 1
MKGYVVRKIGQNKGTPRVWLEGRQPEQSGFLPGQKYEITKTDSSITLALSANGSRVVSKKAKGDRLVPVLDIHSKELLSIFEGCECVRVIFSQDQIVLMPVASDAARLERKNRLAAKLESGEPLSVGSVCHGGGILAHAVHSGLEASGVASRLAFALEMREELIDHAAEANDAWDKDTIAIAAPLQEVAYDLSVELPKVEILDMALPCSGASKSGKSKLGLTMAEQHPHVGFLIAPALALLARVNPAVVIIENVPEYQTTASAEILRGQLNAMGYRINEMVLSSDEFGAMEKRVRWCMVATTEGIDFDFNSLERKPSAQKLGDMLDKVALDDSRWSEMAGLKAKEVRDMEAGKGFKMQIVNENSTKVGTIGKGYAKNRSTEPKVQHPVKKELLRLLTPAEHARIKTIPAHLVANLSNTIAHEILGQSVIHNVFATVAASVGAAIQNNNQNAASFNKMAKAVG